METSSLAPQRQMTGSLSSFTILPPPDKPRTASDILTSVNGSSPHQQPPLYYIHGHWPTSGGTHNSAYSFSNSTPHQPLPQPSPTQRPLFQSLDSTNSFAAARNSSTATNGTPGDNQPTTSSYPDRPPFPGPILSAGVERSSGSGDGGALGSAMSSQAHGAQQPTALAQSAMGGQTPTGSQPPTPGFSTQGGQGGRQDSGAYRQPAPSSYYPPSTSPHQTSFPAFSPSMHHHQSPTNPSPTTTTAPMARGLGTVAGMTPPLGFTGARGHPGMPPVSTYPGYGSMTGPVLSNVHQPGTPLTMMPGVSSMAAYGHLHHHQTPHSYWITSHHAPTQPQQDRPFKCDQCPQSFNRNHDLKRHKRIHLSVKPFPCNWCDKSFSRKDALKRHKLVKGCGEGTKPEETDGGNASTSVEVDGDRDDAGSDQTEPSPGVVRREYESFNLNPDRREQHYRNGEGPHYSSAP